MSEKLHKSKTWIRVAGNADRIKKSETHHWRAYINKEGPMIPLIDVQIEGVCQRGVNPVYGTLTATDPNGLFAWHDYYGDISVNENDVATIYLRKLS